MKNWNILLNPGRQRITQHKRFVSYSTYPNFYFAKTSFMLEAVIRNGVLQQVNTFEEMR